MYEHISFFMLFIYDEQYGNYHFHLPFHTQGIYLFEIKTMLRIFQFFNPGCPKTSRGYAKNEIDILFGKCCSELSEITMSCKIYIGLFCQKNKSPGYHYDFP